MSRAADDTNRRGDRPSPHIVVGLITLGAVIALELLDRAGVLAVSESQGAGPGALPTTLGGEALVARLASGQSADLGLAAVAIAWCLPLGTAIGLAAGFCGGLVAWAVKYLGLLLRAFPRLVFILLVATVIDTRLSTAAIALGISFIPDVAEDVRERVARLKQRDFILAARLRGLGWGRILLHHIGRRYLLPWLVRHAAFIFVYVILVEAGLSYIGSCGGFPRVVDQSGYSLDSLGALLAEARGERDWVAFAVVLTYLGAVTSGLSALGEGVVKRIEA